MSNWNEPHIRQAADFLDQAVRTQVLDGRGVHAATCVACSAWMAGTILYRLEVDGRVDFKPGTVVLSEVVNARLPGFFNLIAALAAQGEPGDAATESLEADSCDARRLTMQQTREALEPVYWAFARRQGLSEEDLLQAATLATAAAAAETPNFSSISLISSDRSSTTMWQSTSSNRPNSSSGVVHSRATTPACSIAVSARWR